MEIISEQTDRSNARTHAHTHTQIPGTIVRVTKEACEQMNMLASPQSRFGSVADSPLNILFVLVISSGRTQSASITVHFISVFLLAAPVCAATALKHELDE